MTPETPAERAAYRRGVADTLALVETVGRIVPALIPPGVRDVSLSELAGVIACVDQRALRILRPYDKAEAVTLKEAADLAGKSESALREWIEKYRIGRLVVGSVMVSMPALYALLDDYTFALAATWRGIAPARPCGPTSSAPGCGGNRDRQAPRDLSRERLSGALVPNHNLKGHQRGDRTDRRSAEHAPQGDSGPEGRRPCDGNAAS
ncbi:hypothetical protein [Lichenifustis flavocetrariae]|uniref:Uncharacterized protein n=1 Tax=Lichenifustis flavocetrariae TaxID=2949735 RepID=A0AA42CKW1_9HYPH|nr:hypothetical protein [Lichenifustis flavocetrariae]MCW6510968.1 hypothetical protein [Lichenifustis flavocetrariae]